MRLTSSLPATATVRQRPAKNQPTLQPHSSEMIGLSNPGLVAPSKKRQPKTVPTPPVQTPPLGLANDSRWGTLPPAVSHPGAQRPIPSSGQPDLSRPMPAAWKLAGSLL